MEQAAQKIGTGENARVVGHIQLNDQIRPPAPQSGLAAETEQMLSEWVSFAGDMDGLKRGHNRIINDILALQAENRWEDIVALFFPLEDKVPEQVAAGMDADIRVKIAFALVRLRRADEAVRMLVPLAGQHPEDAMVHYTLGYAALDELFSARTERRIIPAKRKQELIALAHTHFAAARALRPDSVTFFYREAILYKEIENKPRLAIPLFTQAISNWERQSPQEQGRHHQQRPKYIKSLYHLASCQLAAGQAAQSLKLLQTLEPQDKDRNFMHPLFKHFAFGKVLHALGQYKEAMQHLETAGYVAEAHQPTDFVWELAARCALRLQQTEKAKGFINKVPRNRRRPYVLWTEADILAADGRAREALRVLQSCGERDKRSRHVSLIRMARVFLGLREYDRALEAADRAAGFCRDTYGNPSKEALFWQAAALHLLGRDTEALAIVQELEAGHFRYPHFSRLAGLVRAAVPTAAAAAGQDRQGGIDHGPAATKY